MFIAPQEDESQEEFLTRAEEALRLLGGKSLYSLLKKQPPQERRAENCGTGSGGFKKGNTCAGDAGPSSGKKPSSGKSSSPAIKQIKQLASSGASRKELQAAIEKAIVGKSGWFGGYTPGDSSPSEVCRALGLKIANEDSIDGLMAKSWGYERRAVASAISQLAAAKQADSSGLAGVSIRIETVASAMQLTGESAADLSGSLASYYPATDTIVLFAGVENDDPDILRKLGESGYDSTPDDAHTIIHENAHRSHYNEIRRRVGLERPPKGSGPDEWEKYTAEAEDHAYGSLRKEVARDPEWNARVAEKVKGVSMYAMTDPFEAVAEYTTAVRLGYRDNDKDLDRLCKAALAPVPRRATK